ncbi:uncharacterized protein LOC135950460 [Calliphora vicina]|uniref:uncharacterized protein LOC135950460 n=1 Tax=Calliphora vicina TaxID=7373 RepID=UPI00325B6E9F
MDTTLIPKPSEVFQKNRHSKLYIVQYNKETYKFVRKIIRSHDLVWDKMLPAHQNKEAEPVLVRDEEQIFLGYVLYIADTEQDAINKLNELYDICKQIFFTPQGFSEIVNKIYFNHSFWVLAMYKMSTPLALNGEQYLFGIFHKNDVILKTENHAYNIIVYIQEQQTTQKGFVVKVGNELSDLTSTMYDLRYTAVHTLRKNVITEKQKKMSQLLIDMKPAEDRMKAEAAFLYNGFLVTDASINKAQRRIMYLKNLARRHNLQIDN